MKQTLILAGAAIVLVFTFAFSAMAKPALRDNPEVTQGLIAVGMALEIDKNCDSMSARYLKGLSFLNTLKQLARAQGYTDAEIEAFVENKVEKRRLEARAREILASQGAKPGAPEAYCAVGRAEIERGSPTGGLLRAR